MWHRCFKEKDTMERYDIAVIGTGPAGLEAAITATVRNKKIILFGTKDLSSKMQVVDHPILNYLGLPSVTGKEMAAAFTRQLEELGIRITETKITAVYALPDCFALQTSENTTVEADSVILASGVTAGKPYPGEEMFLGRGVSYCATCDAPLYRGRTVACIGGAAKEEEEAAFLCEICEKVYYFPLYRDEVKISAPNLEVIREKPVSIEGRMKAETLVTNENRYDVSCTFILRESQFPAQLVPGLDTEGNAVKTDLSMATNLPGLFVAGDITGQPYQYIKAAGQGNVAALSAVSYLDRKKREEK